MTTTPEDRAHMAAALALAERGLGDTWPNPSVGCVIVREGVVVGRGWTQSGGRPHGEVEALARAGAAARGATVYVSLEPCNYHGKTPPCTDALVAAGIARAVIAVRDPNPRVNGGGVARLKAAGIAVEEGCMEGEARTLNRGFMLAMNEARTLFTLKTAGSLDARIATASGESKWITGEAARHVAQVLRARHDAILVGSGTALADDPALTCRLDGYAGRAKVRIVLDRRLRIAANSQLARTARDVPTWVVTSSTALARGKPLADAGVSLIPIDAASDVAFAQASARALAERGLTRVLIEGGGQVAAAFLRAGLVDEIAWFRATTLLGGDARPAVADLGLECLAGAPRFARRATTSLGADTLELLERA